MSEKIKPHHLERKAYIYVRQSTPYQVRNHVESRERQYGLAERAKQLGFEEVVVIDDDLGRSGGGMQERPGFGKLLTCVCQGLAGAVFALEASRLGSDGRHHQGSEASLHLSKAGPEETRKASLGAKAPPKKNRRDSE